MDLSPNSEFNFNALSACTIVIAVSFSCLTSAAEDAASLAKAAQNPLAQLVTLPIQVNYNGGVGENDRTLFNMNIQPVVPVKGDDWNVIVRTIIPVNSVPNGETDSISGIGDTTLQLFATPSESQSLTWGFGPVLGLPTASNAEVLGSQKWSAGVGGVLFYNVGNWTLGGLMSNMWSFAGENDRDDVNIFTFQYFANYNFGQGWAVGTVPILTADWTNDSGDQWTIPWGLQVSKVTKIGNQAVNLLAGYYVNSEHPLGGAEDQLRLQLNFMFPN